MRRFLFALVTASLFTATPGHARETVTASEPQKLSVTVYRDNERDEGEEMDADWPEGLAVISETRTVTLPPGRSTIRFHGVSEGMVAISAILSGLPGGTIEKNRNADLLSPAALVNGMLGNRVQITRTNPATGIAATRSAFIRTRADGGLVLETSDGFEAVRCSGLPEKLTFDRVPAGLSANPVFTIDTQDDIGGTYRVTLIYISWGFDWQAHYVATLDDGILDRKRRRGADIGAVDLRLLSWLTVANNNSQSFPDAELLVVAGAINVTSDFEDLADPPTGEPLRLRCYPLGSTKYGEPLSTLAPQAMITPAPMMAAPMAEEPIIVTAARRKADEFDMAATVAMVAAEERLGDLKLYRVPESVTVSANGQKQVAFLNKENVDARFLYVGRCSAYDLFDEIDDVGDMEETTLFLTMENETQRGLGVALPMGGMTLFEPGPAGTQLVGELDMRDYAQGQDIELELAQSTQVFVECAAMSEKPDEDNPRRWTKMRALVSNANSVPAQIRLVLGPAGSWEIRWPRATPMLKDGELIVEVTVPPNSAKSYDWKLRRPRGQDGE